MLVFNFVMLLLCFVLTASLLGNSSEYLFVPFSILLLLALVNIITLQQINKGVKN